MGHYFWGHRRRLRRARLGAAGWLLRDDFADDRAAGSVNGTPAMPGPGTRTVTDPGNTLSVTGGDVAISGGTGHSAPALYYGGHVRAADAGRVLVCEFTGAAGGNGPFIGWATTQNPLVTAHAETCFYPLTVVSALRWRSSNAVVATIAAATSYVLAIVLRSNGGYGLIKGGAFAHWTLLWAAGSGENMATVYPGVTATSGSSWTHAFLRMPDVLWLPTPLAYDTFARGDGALGSSEAAGPDGQAVGARTWINTLGTTEIASSKASASALSGGEAMATVDVSTVDILVQADLARAGDEVGLVLRYADAQNYVVAYHDGTNAKLDKVVGGATTSVISGAAAYSANATLVVVADGTSFSLFYDDAKIGATSTINDAALQTGTAHGLYSANTGNTHDNFSVMPRGSHGEYADLDQWSGEER
ncbi:MAG: hypothetical protein JXA09_03965 [Anaerolineae bacterium]|nr:hypothetical protein [Anaerolineae bacterium]